jgi:hypothetical protein
VIERSAALPSQAIHLRADHHPFLSLGFTAIGKTKMVDSHGKNPGYQAGKSPTVEHKIGAVSIVESRGSHPFLDCSLPWPSVSEVLSPLFYHLTLRLALMPSSRPVQDKAQIPISWI